MLRRVLCLAGLLSLAGCQQILEKDGSYSVFKMHAERLDSEFDQFYVDVKDVFFGLDREVANSTWLIYGD